MEALSAQEEQERRRKFSRQLRDIAANNIAKIGFVGAKFIVNPDMRSVYTGPYGNLTRDLFIDFNGRAKASNDQELIDLAKSRAIFSGFHTISKILSYAPEAYKRHLSSTGEESSMTEIKSALKRSSGILKMFAGLDSDRNYMYESAFDLRRPTKKQAMASPFVFERGDDGELMYIPDPNVVAIAEKYVALTPPSQAQSSASLSKRCPALGQVLTQQWENAVEACVTRPELFQSDLSQLA